MSEQSLEVRIRSEGDDPPTGEVVDSSGRPFPFAGWLDLMQTLERLASEVEIREEAPAANLLSTASLAEAPG
jgi:hypothetical protein